MGLMVVADCCSGLLAAPPRGRLGGCGVANAWLGAGSSTMAAMIESARDDCRPCISFVIDEIGLSYCDSTVRVSIETVSRCCDAKRPLKGMIDAKIAI
jgi:hypothetical protein